MAISPLSPRRLIDDAHHVKRRAAVENLRGSFDEVVKKFVSAVDELDESGFTFKLDQVLYFRYRRIFRYLHEHRLAYWTAQASFLSDGKLFFGDEAPNRAFVAEYWSNLEGEPDSSWRVLDACGLLTAGLREVAAKFGTYQWQLAIAEQYLYTLSRTVSRTLHPTVLERLRQAIGK